MPALIADFLCARVDVVHDPAGILKALRGGITSIEHGYEFDNEGIELMLVCVRVLVRRGSRRRGDMSRR